MSDLKEQQTGASGDNFTVGGNLAVTGTTVHTGATTFTGAVVFSSTVSGLTNITLDTPTINSPVIVYEGATANDFETTLAVVDPTADRTLTFPDKTGTVAVTSDLPSATALFTSSGTYAIAGSTSLVVTSSSHGRAVGDVVYLEFTSGGLTNGYFTITAVTTDTLTVTYGSSTTASGNVTGYYSNLGTVALASSVETIAGTSTDRAVTPAGVDAVFDNYFEGTKTSDGYQKLAGGLILQWGKQAGSISSGATTTFPIPFPNDVFSITATGLSAGSNLSGNPINIDSRYITTTNFVMDSDSAYVNGAYWFAIGY
jgi:hypothetical protein